MDGKMNKRLGSGVVIFSLILVFVLVVYLNAAPYTCDEQDEIYCEAFLEGDFYYYFEFTTWYYGDWVDVYHMYCEYEISPGMGPEMVDWGLCYDFNDIY